MQSRDSHNKRDQNHSNYKSTDQVNVIKDSFVNTTGRFDLQLNPWNNLEQQSVANAIVLASSALPSLYPIVNAIMTMVQIDNPSSPILIKKSFVKMDSFIGRGFFFHHIFRMWFQSKSNCRKTVCQQINEQQMNRCERYRKCHQ